MRNTTRALLILAILLPAFGCGTKSTGMASDISGRTYTLENNQFGLMTCSLTFDNNQDEAAR